MLNFVLVVDIDIKMNKEDIEMELNKMYYPYGVSVKINVSKKMEDDSWDLNGDEKLDVGEAGFFSFRTAEMQGVHRLNVDRNLEEIYLYVLDRASKEGVEGDMPLGSQYGFLFGTPTARTIAHEIGHGYFQLEHTFSDKYKFTQGATDNLMDYATGTKLYKYQWDLMHAKGLLVSKLWQSDSAGEMANKKFYKINLSDLKDVFPNLTEALVEVINDNSSKFGINTKERMSHFLAQVGAETGGMKNLSEDINYTAKNIKDRFGKHKYCDLFEGYNCTDVTQCDIPNKKPLGCLPIMLDTVRLANKKVKQEYIADESLFDYVYSCRMGNGAKSTKDGSTFMGKGFIHLTGKEEYERISNLWNADKDNAKNKKYFHKQKNEGGHIQELESNIEVAMKASMYYWQKKNLNEWADKGTSENDVKNIGFKINYGSIPQSPELYNQGPNGHDKRLKYFNDLNKKLK